MADKDYLKNDLQTLRKKWRANVTQKRTRNVTLKKWPTNFTQKWLTNVTQKRKALHFHDSFYSKNNCNQSQVINVVIQ